MSKFYEVNDKKVSQAYTLGKFDETHATLEAFVDSMKDGLVVNILAQRENELEFEIVGIDAAIANALRRIMIAEVPTMAIETVLISDNTSIIQDDVLAHRLGLIPINADPEAFGEWKKGEPGTENNTIEFKLEVKCQGSPVQQQVYSDALQWVPIGDQYERLKESPPKPVYSDILLAQMKSGQEIDIRVHCVKGIGQDHAKWSPVSTASYRILPMINLKKPFEGDEADSLVNSCPMGVFDIEDIGGTKRAVVGNARKCTMCRECIRDPARQPLIQLLRKADHFLFSVESVGALAPEVIVRKALQVLKKKATDHLKKLEAVPVTTES